MSTGWSVLALGLMLLLVFGVIIAVIAMKIWKVKFKAKLIKSA